MKAALAVVLLSSVASGFAPAVAQVSAKEQAALVQSLIDKGSWEEARQALDTARSRCDAADDAVTCSAELDFTRGYLYSRQARADAKRRDELNREAKQAYAQVLEARPEDKRAMTNLALVCRDLGEWQAADAWLVRAMPADPQRAYSYQMTRGRVLEQSDPPAAVTAYSRAAQLDGEREDAYRAIINLARQGRVDPEVLLERAAAMRNGLLPHLAVEALELVIHESYASHPPLADEALLRWAELRAERNGFSAAAVANLPGPAAWPSPRNRRLHALAADPTVQWQAWASRNPVEKDLAARLMRNLASAERMEHGDTAAMPILEAALNVAPDAFVYDAPPLQGRTIVRLDVSLDLAVLYHRANEEEELERLIRDLFHDKSEAYRRQDGHAIQRFHTVLGLIYAERNQWTGNGFAGNAVFQLEHALEAAAGNALREATAPEPLPELRALLAQGYAVTHRPKQASSMALEAAEGYLELDDLRQAEALHSRAMELGLNAGARGRAEAIARILSTRRWVESANPATLERLPSGEPKLPPEHAWLIDPSGWDLAAGFVNRQRFKALSDLGCKGGATPYQAAYFGARALESLGEDRVVTSFADVDRLRHVSADMVARLSGERTVKPVEVGSHLTAVQKAGSVKMAVGPPERRVEIMLDPDVFVAGQLFRQAEILSAVESGRLVLDVSRGAIDARYPAVLEPEVRHALDRAAAKAGASLQVRKLPKPR